MLNSFCCSLANCNAATDNRLPHLQSVSPQHKSGGRFKAACYVTERVLRDRHWKLLAPLSTSLLPLYFTTTLFIWLTWLYSKGTTIYRKYSCRLAECLSVDGCFHEGLACLFRSCDHLTWRCYLSRSQEAEPPANNVTIVYVVSKSYLTTTSPILSDERSVV